MTLEKRNIPIDFGGQLDTKTDPKHVLPGNFTLIQNAVRKKGKMFAKRPGSSKLAADVGAEGKGVIEYKGQLVKFEDDLLKVHSEAADEWIPRGDLVSCMARADTVIRGATSYFDIDSSSNGEYTAYVYSLTLTTEAYGGVYYSLYDENSKTFILKDVLVNAAGFFPKVLISANYVYITYCTQPLGASLYWSYYDIGSPTSTNDGAAHHGIDAFSSHRPAYDIALIPGVIGQEKLLMIYGSVANSDLRLSELVPTVSFTETTIASEVCNTACTLVLTGSLIYAIYYNHVGSGSNRLRAKIMDYSLTQVVAPFSIDTVSHPSKFDAVTAVSYPDGTGVQVFYGGGTQNYVYSRKVTSVGSIGSASLSIEDTRIRSKAFVRTVNGLYSFYVCIENISEIQPTYLILRDDGFVAATLKSSLARGLEYPYYTTPVISLATVYEDAGVYSFATSVRERVFQGNSGLESTSAIAKTTIDFTQGFSCKKVGENLLIAGGKVVMYDGSNVVEQGFHLFPEAVVQSEDSTPGNLYKNKEYQAVLVYEWADANGTIHRSAPSIPVTYVGTSTTYKAEIDLSFEPLQFTDKVGVATVLYRTEGDRTVFYRVSPLKLTPTSPEILGTSIIDDTSDTDLIKNEILYTTGGILENIGPPNARHVSEFNGRAVLSGTESGEVWFSKKVAARTPVQFSDFLIIPAPDGEAIKATASIDEKLILMRENGSPYFTYGDGPDNLGSGSFAQPIKMNVDGSLKDAASLINIPNQGLAFNTSQGIYQIGRDLQSFYFGAPVDDWKGATIVGTAIDEKESLVYFFTSESPTLVFDYAWQQWYVFTISGVGCAMYGGAAAGGVKSLTYIKSNGDVYIGDATLFKDGGTHYIIKAVTGGLQVAGLSGFQRIYRAAFNAVFKGGHNLKIGMGYDYKDDFESEINFDASTLDGEQYRIQSHLKTQKCEAIRFSIEEESDGYFDVVSVAQSLSDTGGSGLASNVNAALGQTFLAPASGTFSEITLELYGDAALTGNLALSFYDTSAGLPSGAATATSNNVDASSLGLTAQSVTFVFASPVAVVQGVTYGFALFGTHSGGTLRFKAKYSDVYADGTRVSTANGGSSWTPIGEELKFSIEILTPTTGEALEMDSIALIVGVKRGFAKLRAALKVPTT